MRHILRILVSPFILGLLLVNYNYHALKRWCLFLRYGGEWINYTKQDRVTIQMIYELLVKSEIPKRNPHDYK